MGYVAIAGPYDFTMSTDSTATVTVPSKSGSNNLLLAAIQVTSTTYSGAAPSDVDINGTSADVLIVDGVDGGRAVTMVIAYWKDSNWPSTGSQTLTITGKDGDGATGHLIQFNDVDQTTVVRTIVTATNTDKTGAGLAASIDLTSNSSSGDYLICGVMAGDAATSPSTFASSGGSAYTELYDAAVDYGSNVGAQNIYVDDNDNAATSQVFEPTITAGHTWDSWISYALPIVPASSATTYTKTATLDALLQKVGVTKTATLDATLFRQFTLESTLDAILQKSVAATAALDALLLKQGVTTTSTLDAIVALRTDLTATLDAIMQKTELKTADLDTLIKKDGVTVTSTLDAILQEAFTLSATLDALLAKTATQYAFLDAMVQQSFTVTASLDTYVFKWTGPSAGSGSWSEEAGASGVWTPEDETSNTWS